MGRIHASHKNISAKSLIKKYFLQSLGARPFSKSLMTPANATDVQQFSPQHKAGISSGPGLNLRTPSSFINKNPTSTFQTSYSLTEPPPLPLSQPPSLPNNALPLNLESMRTQIMENSIEPLSSSQTSNILSNSTPSNLELVRTQILENSVENSPQGRYHRALINVPNESNVTKSELVDDFNNPQKSTVFSPFSKSQNNLGSKGNILTIGNIDTFLSKSGELPQELAERMLSEALLPPSAVHANDIIGSTLDEKGLMYIREKLNSMNSNKEDVQHRGPFKSREIDDFQNLEMPNKEIDRLINTRHEFSTCRSDTLPQFQDPQMSGFAIHGKHQGNQIAEKYFFIVDEKHFSINFCFNRSGPKFVF